MRTYLILQEKAQRFNADAEIQDLLRQVNADDGAMLRFEGSYSPQKAAELKTYPFDAQALSQRGLMYERLDQLTVELLLGIR
jgi:xylose isomerase